jgi:hypothetical protein
VPAAAERDLGQGRALAVPAFADDDGTANARTRALFVDALTVDGGLITLGRALRRVRLLSCVVAVADDPDETGGGDTGSHMAAVSMVNERGEKGLLAFTGVDSLAAWSPTARPVPALGREMAQAAIQDGAEAVVIDVAGPCRRVISGTALRVLADDLDLDEVAIRVRAALGALTADGLIEVDVTDARAHELAADVLVTVIPSASSDSTGPQLAAQAARLLAQRADVNELVPGGIGVTSG